MAIHTPAGTRSRGSHKKGKKGMMMPGLKPITAKGGKK